jgi:hypothetical protein
MKQWLVWVFMPKKGGELQLFDEWLVGAATEDEARAIAQEQVKNAYPDASDWSVQEYTERRRKAYQGFGYEPGDEVSKYYHAELPDYERPESERREYDLPSPARTASLKRLAPETATADELLGGQHELTHDDLLDMWQKAKTLPEPQRQKAIRYITHLSKQLESEPAKMLVNILLETRFLAS